MVRTVDVLGLDYQIVLLSRDLRNASTGYVFHEVPLFSGVYFRCMRERAGKYRILHKVLMIFIIGRKKKFYKLQNLDRGADFVYSIKDIKRKVAGV